MTAKRFAFMEKFVVPHFDRTDENYLERLRIIQTPWFAIYLHRLGTPDSRPVLHDHPWSFVSFILRGGYIEKRLNKHTMQAELRYRRWVNIMRRDDAHYIVELDREPTWTLLFVGKRRRTWGYWRKMTGDPEGVRRQTWTWTPFDRDVHADEFDRIMERR